MTSPHDKIRKEYLAACLNELAEMIQTDQWMSKDDRPIDTRKLFACHALEIQRRKAEINKDIDTWLIDLLTFEKPEQK